MATTTGVNFFLFDHATYINYDNNNFKACTFNIIVKLKHLNRNSKKLLDLSTKTAPHGKHISMYLGSRVEKNAIQLAVLNWKKKILQTKRQNEIIYKKLVVII